MTVFQRERAEGYASVNGVDMYWRSVGAGGTPLVVVPGRTRYGVFQAPELAGLVASFLP
ncbi:MAG TPA: hypothetical protein VIH08_00435 [Blastococcus sp.]